MIRKHKHLLFSGLSLLLLCDGVSLAPLPQLKRGATLFFVSFVFFVRFVLTVSTGSVGTEVGRVVRCCW